MHSIGCWREMIKFKTPFQSTISGPSGCGKTTFITRFINNSHRLCDRKFDKIIWCHSETNSKPKDLKVPTQFVIEVPDDFENKKNENICIVIDDLMGENDKRVSELFTRGSHHRHLTVFYLVQNLFNKSPHSRSISLNTRYFVLFKNPRDVSQIGYFARQLCPENYNDFVRVFKEITDQPHSYLLIDCSQETPNCLRFRTNIFEPNFSQVFCEKPTNNTIINGKKIEIESIGKEQAYAICSRESEPTFGESNL